MNTDKLNHLFSNDKKLVNQFLAIFKNETPKQLSKLNTAIQKEDWETVSILAHSIKSQVKYLDLSKIAAIAALIESNAEKKENLASMPGNLQSLKTPLLAFIQNM